MTVPKTFPWKRFIFFLVISAAVAFVVYDSNEHGGFAKSDTKKFLKESGIWSHGQTALKQTIIFSRKAVKWSQENGHVYYGHAKDFLLPYVELMHNLFIVAKNAYFELLEIIMLRVPVVVAIIESYAPGLVDKVVEVSHYIGNLIVEYFGIVREYLVTKVFVGQLSPDNLQKATLEALNTTQQYATRYYDWFYEMISNVD